MLGIRLLMLLLEKLLDYLQQLVVCSNGKYVFEILHFNELCTNTINNFICWISCYWIVILIEKMRNQLLKENWVKIRNHLIQFCFCFDKNSCFISFFEKIVWKGNYLKQDKKLVLLLQLHWQLVYQGLIIIFIFFILQNSWQIFNF